MNRRTPKPGFVRATSFVVLALSVACNSGGSATPTAALLFPPPAATQAEPSPTSTLPQPTAAAPTETSLAPGEPIFSVGVVVDTTSEQVTREQAQAVINEAAAHLHALVPVIMVMTDVAEDAAGGATTDMLQRYMLGHTGALPNGVVIFSAGDEGKAKAQGSYAYAAPAPEGYRNSFVSALVGGNQLYVAVVDYRHKYMACGYGGADTVTSSTALGGECENHPGAACVQQNGYSMCSSAVGRLYMSTPTYYAASMIVHGLLQPFALNGSQDDYDTAECTARMGYPAGFHDLQEAQYHNDLCPSVYDEFLKSYRP